ncbi:MAG: hypothetical protein JWO06_4094 [Bacteroidota bacterium]|nr:hypothetical protein [Bacteroidota bacterium]
MHLSKLIYVLKALDTQTFKRFGEYVNSDYFKVPKASIQLFQHLEKVYPDFRETKIHPTAISAKVPNLKTAVKQAKAGTELLKAFENFVALEDCQGNERNKYWHQLNSFNKLHLSEQFSKLYEKAQDELDKCPDQDVDTFLYRHEFTELYFNSFDGKLGRSSQNDITPILKTLDEYYALKKLRYLCEAINRKNVLGIDFASDHIQMLLEILKPYDNERYPYVHLFINVFRMLSAKTYEDSELPYLALKQTASRFDKKVLSSGLTECVESAISSCLFWSAQGIENAGKEYLWWIEFKIKWNLLLDNGKITPIAFRNIVSSATIYGKNSEWIRQFIKVYSQNLPAEERDTNVAFALGLYYYSTKEHSTAVRYFLNAQAKEEVVFNAIIRRWQWMSTYEANPAETDLLLNQALAFEKYLLRNKTEFHHYKAGFTSFITYCKKLISGCSKKDQLANIEALEMERHFPGKPWLLQQYNTATQRIRPFAEQTLV